MTTIKPKTLNEQKKLPKGVITLPRLDRSDLITHEVFELTKPNLLGYLDTYIGEKNVVSTITGSSARDLQFLSATRGHLAIAFVGHGLTRSSFTPHVVMSNLNVNIEQNQTVTNTAFLDFTLKILLNSGFSNLKAYISADKDLSNIAAHALARLKKEQIPTQVTVNKTFKSLTIDLVTGLPTIVKPFNNLALYLSHNDYRKFYMGTCIAGHRKTFERIPYESPPTCQLINTIDEHTDLNSVLARSCPFENTSENIKTVTNLIHKRRQTMLKL